jgi:hypothetical protein
MCNVICMGWVGCAGRDLAICGVGWVGVVGLVFVVILPFYSLILCLCLGYYLSYMIHLFFIFIAMVICNIVGYSGRILYGICRFIIDLGSIFYVQKNTIDMKVLNSLYFHHMFRLI